MGLQNTVDGLRKTIATLESHIMSKLSDLEAQVKATTDVEASAVKLIQGIAAQIAANASDEAKVTELAATLKASADSLGAAVAANTPAA